MRAEPWLDEIGHGINLSISFGCDYCATTRSKRDVAGWQFPTGPPADECRFDGKVGSQPTSRKGCEWPVADQRRVRCHIHFSGRQTRLWMGEVKLLLMTPSSSRRKSLLLSRHKAIQSKLLQEAPPFQYGANHRRKRGPVPPPEGFARQHAT